MPTVGPDLYGALLAFLDGDAGDVRTRLNTIDTARLPTGSVTFTRASRGRTAQRGRHAKTPAVDLILTEDPGAVRPAGIGVEEQDFEVRAEITVREKDLPTGKVQLRVLESIQNDLVGLYRGLSDLTITDPNGIATFVRASARRGTIDRTPASQELETAIVVLTFTFLVPLSPNT